MTYPTNTALILIFMGFSPRSDFNASAEDDGVHLKWHSLLPQPTPEEIAQQELPWYRNKAHTIRSAERLRRQISGFTYDNHRYASDREESIPLLTAACIGAQLALAQGEEAAAIFGAAMGAGWRDMEGAPRISTAIGILGLHAAFTAHGATCDVISQRIKAEIDAAETVEVLEMIIATIPTDVRWPV